MTSAARSTGHCAASCAGRRAQGRIHHHLRLASRIEAAVVACFQERAAEASLTIFSCRRAAGEVQLGRGPRNPLMREWWQLGGHCHEGLGLCSLCARSPLPRRSSGPDHVDLRVRGLRLIRGLASLRCARVLQRQGSNPYQERGRYLAPDLPRPASRARCSSGSLSCEMRGILETFVP